MRFIERIALNVLMCLYWRSCLLARMSSVTV